MLFRRFDRLLTLALTLGITAAPFASGQDSSHRGRKYKAPPPTSRVEVTVLRADDQRPIENAAVVFTLEGDKGNMELKTNEDGKAVIDVLPTGSKVLLQVLAKGFQTYGKDYTLDKAEMALSVQLNRPGKQYSIYEKHPNTAKQGDGPSKDQPSSPDKDSPKSDAHGSADQPAAKPDSSQPSPQ
jgi:hypothetical protein